MFSLQKADDFIRVVQSLSESNFLSFRLPFRLSRRECNYNIRVFFTLFIIFLPLWLSWHANEITTIITTWIRRQLTFRSREWCRCQFVVIPLVVVTAVATLLFDFSFEAASDRFVTKTDITMTDLVKRNKFPEIQELAVDNETSHIPWCSIIFIHVHQECVLGHNDAYRLLLHRLFLSSKCSSHDFSCTSSRQKKETMIHDVRVSHLKRTALVSQTTAEECSQV